MFDFSQKDYICFDFVPRHHNIIRYRKSLALINDDFATVCSWVQFKNLDAWKYDLMLGEDKNSNDVFMKTKQTMQLSMQTLLINTSKVIVLYNVMFNENMFMYQNLPMKMSINVHNARF